MVLFADEDVSAFRASQQTELERARELPAEQARARLRRLALAEERWLAERRSAARERVTCGLASGEGRGGCGMSM